MEPEGVEKPSAKLYLIWLLLPAVASLLLLAITNHLSQNVAAIPFLWVLPLSIYLLTFILCFEGSGWYRRNPYLQLLAVALGSMAYALSVDSTGSVPIRVMVPLFAMGLFTCCMVCHGELARLKPDPRYLTHFYVMIAAGGALGGLAGGPGGAAPVQRHLRDAAGPGGLRGAGAVGAAAGRGAEMVSALAAAGAYCGGGADGGAGGIRGAPDPRFGARVARDGPQFLWRAEGAR